MPSEIRITTQEEMTNSAMDLLKMTYVTTQYNNEDASSIILVGRSYTDDGYLNMAVYQKSGLISAARCEAIKVVSDDPDSVMVTFTCDGRRWTLRVTNS